MVPSACYHLTIHVKMWKYLQGEKVFENNEETWMKDNPSGSWANFGPGQEALLKTELK